MSFTALIRAGVGLAPRARHEVSEAAAADAQAGLPSAAHIAFNQVGKHYPGAAGPVRALQEVSFEVRRGEVFGIIGRSGAGKSTLLRTINALERPDAGAVKVNGVDVGTLGEDGLVALRRRVGMIFQHFNLLSAKTVRDNVGLPLRVAGVPSQQIRERVEALLALVGLADKADVYPAKLSGSQKQRVGIARALVHQPDILLCDEATSALDPETTQSILALLREVSASMGLTVVLITHDMAVIREICDRVLVLDQGRAVELGEVWRVFGSPQAEATRSLLRPLQHGVPPDLAQQLVDDLHGAPGQAVLSLCFTGAEGAQGVSLQALAALGPQATLLHGGLDRIRGHAQGELLVALPADDVARMRSLFKDELTKVIGYVPART